MSASDTVDEKAMYKALGQVLRRVRESRGWTRQQLADRLPSGIGERTVLSYEHGVRHPPLGRIVEICRVLHISVPVLIDEGLRLAGDLTILRLTVDLKKVGTNKTPQFQAVQEWAREHLNAEPESELTELTPATIHELAIAFRMSHRDLARYLFTFATPVQRW